MSSFPLCHGIIPARYESTRFPGKPLADLLGKPMFWHVYDRARQCAQLQSVTLATDDERIFAAAKELDVPVVMTAANHASGTDRVLEAARAVGVQENEVVVNIQGDEPALEPAMLDELLSPFQNSNTMIATLVSRIGAKEAASPDRVKAVVSQDGRALYFSRAMVPFNRETEQHSYHLHIGVYAFRMEALAHFGQLAPSPLEKQERLEQLRFLENGYSIHVTETTHTCHGVDRPEDLATVISILEQQ